jgi:hypothetical protein
MFIQTGGHTMRNNWILTPFEMAVFIGCAALLAGGFVMLANA